MALAHTDRLRARMTWADRIALSAAQRIEDLVAWRMTRRAEEVRRVMAQHEAQRRLRATTDDSIARAGAWQMR